MAKTYRRLSTELKLGGVKAYRAGEGGLKGLAAKVGFDHSLVDYLQRKCHVGELSLDLSREEESVETAQHRAALERKVGQITMELDVLKRGLVAAPFDVQRGGPHRANHQRVMQARLRPPPSSRRRPWVVAEPR